MKNKNKYNKEIRVEKCFIYENVEYKYILQIIFLEVKHNSFYRYKLKLLRASKTLNYIFDVTVFFSKINEVVAYIANYFFAFSTKFLRKFKFTLLGNSILINNFFEIIGIAAILKILPSISFIFRKNYTRIPYLDFTVNAKALTIFLNYLFRTDSFYTDFL